MRRTYRSKKESNSALDHRDVIQGLDEKASVFDAFYIKNIKQTKRELSCIGSSNHFAPANRVRKRKYVKRIVKEVEETTTLRESMPLSVLLTPDKSIRVNKAQDLFDQLLNSHSPHPKDSSIKNDCKANKFQPRIESKTYARRKILKTKNKNFSSDDSFDSNKENSSENSKSHDITDIRNHELLIEREKKPSRENMDESINNIFKNISILNNINRQRKSSFSPIKTSILSEDHRLTANFNSSDSSKSPICSTPFKEKYRSQSIYKFSPIVLDIKTESPKHLTVLKESCDGSLVCIDENNESKQYSIEELAPPSPIIHLTANKSNKSSKTASKIEFDIPSPTKNTIEPVTETLDYNKKNKLSSLEISPIHTTEAELFLGFPNISNEIEEVKKTHILLTNSNIEIDNFNELELKHDDTVNIQEKIIEKNSPRSEIDISSGNVSFNSQVTEDSSYDTCNSEQSSSNYRNIDANKVPVVEIYRLNDSILMKYIENMNLNGSQESDMINSDDYASFNNRDSSILNSNRSEDSNISANTTDHENNNNDISNTSNIEESSYADRISVESISINSSTTNSDSRKETNDIENELKDSIVSHDLDIHNNLEEDKWISFVTTRRRNDIGSNSIILSFDSTISSTSSADCDKTVVSNNENKVKDTIRNENKDCYITNDKDQIITNKETDKVIDANCEHSGISGVVTRKSSTLTRDCDLASCSTVSSFKDSETEAKPAIVLQPGKKWERSLSIYRRMTMMTDHFDHSILEDEQLPTKGRKYRQSVITTMEMQDYRGSIHNESILSRRSTFVSKPCRNTIRIVKEPNDSRLSICPSTISEDLKGFLSEDCDDTVVELSKLSIADSEHEVTVLEQFHDTSNRVPTARDYVLRRCNQTDAILFDECYPDAVLKNCRKIGEGVYGEVFLWRARDGCVRVMKIVPIAGTTKVNGDHQKDFNEIISEIVIAMELSALRAPIDEIQRKFDEGKNIDALDLHSVENATDVFNEVLAVRCVSGSYPSRLLDLWELYDECKGSENDNPAILPVDQQYIVLELANAGQDLESFEFNNAEQAHALFLQVAFGLAVGEEAFQFEHRDLHWGNILIAPTDQKLATFVLRGRAYRIPRRGVAATIIDYSLSRVSLPLAGERAALYNDLAADDGLFDAVGDYQFEVYRCMRDKLGNDWKNFEPYTNILWLHYTVDKMITALRYKRTNTKIHKHYIAKLKGIKNRILEYGSAAQFVLTDIEF